MGKQRMHWTQIVCPFFHSDDYNSIICEGAAENTSVRQFFKDKKERWAWQKRYCFKIDGCKECPVYRMANEKYK